RRAVHRPRRDAPERCDRGILPGREENRLVSDTAMSPVALAANEGESRFSRRGSPSWSDARSRFSRREWGIWRRRVWRPRGQTRCDLIVAQGTEAGGHVRGKTGLLALLSEVLESVHAPVVAAGGIGSGRAMAASLAAGAAAVRVGTRFVAATEAEAHPAYLEKLIAAEAKDSV